MFESAQELWVWLSLVCGAGSNYVSGLIGYFGDIRSIYKADSDELRKFLKAAGYKSNAVFVDKMAEKDLTRAKEIVKYCRKTHIGILSVGDKYYPQQLGKLKNLPPVLYYVGTVPDTVNNLAIAVVGTRKMTDYGKTTAYDITFKLAKAGSVIVSGLAKGIDGTAAAATLDAGGITVAVLGSGIDVLYPREHDVLYTAIARNGMIITEFPPSTMPEAKNFPIRNRIIAGLARATLIVEGDTSSGALITARSAAAQGRDIFAVPGPVTCKTSAGPNALIRDGATIALTATDILEVYREKFPQTVNIFKAWKQQDFTSEYVDERLRKWHIAGIPERSFADADRRLVAGSNETQKQHTVEVKQYARVNAGESMEDFDAEGTSFTAPAAIYNYINKTMFHRETPPPAKEDAPNAEVSPTVASISEIANTASTANTANIEPEADEAAAAEISEAVDALHEPYESMPEQSECIKDSEAAETVNTPELDGLSDDERHIYDLMNAGEMTNADMLISKGVSPSDAAAYLTMLTLKGIIKEVPGNYFIK